MPTEAPVMSAVLCLLSIGLNDEPAERTMKLILEARACDRFSDLGQTAEGGGITYPRFEAKVRQDGQPKRLLTHPRCNSRRAKWQTRRVRSRSAVHPARTAGESRLPVLLCKSPSAQSMPGACFAFPLRRRLDGRFPR